MKRIFAVCSSLKLFTATLVSSGKSSERISAYKWVFDDRYELWFVGDDKHQLMGLDRSDPYMIVGEIPKMREFTDFHRARGMKRILPEEIGLNV